MKQHEYNVNQHDYNVTWHDYTVKRHDYNVKRHDYTVTWHDYNDKGNDYKYSKYNRSRVNQVSPKLDGSKTNDHSKLTLTAPTSTLTSSTNNLAASIIPFM